MRIIKEGNSLFLNDRFIGTLDYGRKCFFTHRDETHIFHKFGDGFGLSEKVLDTLLYYQIEKIIVKFRYTKVYFADTNDFLTKAEEYNDKGDKQLILPLKYWKERVGQVNESQLHLT